MGSREKCHVKGYSFRRIASVRRIRVRFLVLQHRVAFLFYVYFAGSATGLKLPMVAP